MVAQGLKLSDVLLLDDVGVAVSFVVVGAEVDEAGIRVRQQVPDDVQDVTAHGAVSWSCGHSSLGAVLLHGLDGYHGRTVQAPCT